MKNLVRLSILLFAIGCAQAGQFRHVGDFLLQSHYKLAGTKMTAIPMKAIAFHVFTDGVTIRVSPEGQENSHTSFEIYRSDGIGRQRAGSGALEVVPGVQAYTSAGGTLRHLRISQESMTITTFPGVSDQTIVSYSIAATPVDENTGETAQKP